MMRFEHTAYNVQDPEAVAAWYAKTFDMDIVRASKEGLKPHFVSDKERRLTWEFYNNPAGAIHDQSKISQWTQHVALAVDDVSSVRAQLLAAGCTPEGEVGTVQGGDAACFVRDPWGLCLQLVKRIKPLY